MFRCRRSKSFSLVSVCPTTSGVGSDGRSIRLRATS